MTLRSFALLALATLAFAASAGAAVVGRHVMARDAAGQRAKVAARTRPRSLDGVRKLDVAHQDEQNYDAGFDTCSAYDRRSLAHRLGLETAAAPSAIADAFAGRYPVDLRRGVRSGCLDALTGRDES